MIYATGEAYKGDWQLNVREGQGELKSTDGNTYRGEFKAHWPNGQVTIQYKNGSLYQGQVVKGVKQGMGKQTNLDKTVYEGEFDCDKRQGKGRFNVQGGTYVLDSVWVDDKPEIEGNQVIYKPIKKPEEEAAETAKPDPKAKKPDPKKKQ